MQKLRYQHPRTELYHKQLEIWPKEGKHILAQYDDDAVLVYQAYNPTIAKYAIKHKKFEGCPGYSPTRMTWIKTNFLWMMYRSGWGSKRDQEMTLGIWLKREAFEHILETAVQSSVSSNFEDKEEWRKALDKSDIRLQWDPGHQILSSFVDHSPTGEKMQRRAVQLGLRKCSSFVNGDWIVDIVDMTPFVDEQSLAARTQELITPEERVYTPLSDNVFK